MSLSGPSPCKCQIKREEDGRSEEWNRYEEAVKELGNCQSEMEKLDMEMSNEIIEVGDKYNKLRKQYYDKRAEIIEKIPDFWRTAIVNHPRINWIIEEDEEECLKFLKQLKLEEFPSGKFNIKFVFSENPFFENEEITKEIDLGSKPESTSTSTVISWKEGNDLSKKQAEYFAEQKENSLEMMTFFSWFSDNEDPDFDEIADAIKDDVWPDALQYYLLEPMDEDEEESISDEEEDSDEGCRLREEEEEEEEEESDL